MMTDFVFEEGRLVILEGFISLSIDFLSRIFESSLGGLMGMVWD